MVAPDTLATGAGAGVWPEKGGGAAGAGAVGTDGGADVQPAMMAATPTEVAASSVWRSLGR